MSAAVYTCPDPRSEGQDDDIDFEGAAVAEEGVSLADAGILTPVTPVFDSIFGGLINNSIGDC